MDVTNENFGFQSPHWMLQVVVSQADPEALRLGVIEMINYLVHNDDPTTADAFDILAQYCGVGRYIPTRDATEEEAESESRVMDPTRRDNEYSGYDPTSVDQMVAEFMATLDKMPSAEEPTTNEEENE